MYVHSLTPVHTFDSSVECLNAEDGSKAKSNVHLAMTQSDAALE